MIFEPDQDESIIINTIRHLHSEDYALLRLTYTMIDKNNIDAGALLRTILFENGLVDYDLLPSGGHNGIQHNALFIQAGHTDWMRLNFYRVRNERGDRRFSIDSIRNRYDSGQIDIGDLLYFSVCDHPVYGPTIYVINLTNNTPTEDDIIESIGVDATAQLLIHLQPRLREIVHGGFFPNSKGPGPFAPKDVGDTLEYLLGIETNNRDNADYNGLIELKSKTEADTLDTLFTLRPHFEGTRVASIEPRDRNRVSAFTRLYGYESPRHPGDKTLHITIGPRENPQNQKGFYLHVNDEGEVINLVHTDQFTQEREVAAFWPFFELKHALLQKHPATLWFRAETRVENNMVYFRYSEIEFSRSPQFSTFLSLTESGIVTYDWRGYVAPYGRYTGHNHGNAWRIKPEARAALFDECHALAF